jgi:hypothetical protein
MDAQMDHESIWNVQLTVQEDTDTAPPPSVRAVSLSGSDLRYAHRVM